LTDRCICVKVLEVHLFISCFAGSASGGKLTKLGQRPGPYELTYKVIKSIMKYELTYILSSALAENMHSGINQEILSYVEAAGAKVVKQQFTLGRRKLAYPISKQKQGFYVTMEFELEDGSTLKELDHKLRLNQNILRHLIIKRAADSKYGPAKVLQYTDKVVPSTRGRSPRREIKETPRKEEKVTPKISTKEIDAKLDEILKEEPKIEID